jgi:hypothetical protein
MGCNTLRVSRFARLQTVTESVFVVVTRAGDGDGLDIEAEFTQFVNQASVH